MSDSIKRPYPVTTLATTITYLSVVHVSCSLTGKKGRKIDAKLNEESSAFVGSVALRLLNTSRLLFRSAQDPRVIHDRVGAWGPKAARKAYLGATGPSYDRYVFWVGRKVYCRWRN